MPSYRITAPDGTTYALTPPEGASEADIQAQIAHITGAPAAQSAPTKPTGQTDFQRRSRQRLADLQTQTGAANYAQDMSNAKGEFAGQVAAAVPLGIAAPLTGGASLAGGLAMAGAAGATGGLLRETTKGAFGSNDIPMTGKEIAKTLSLDAVLGVAGEGGGRAISGFSKQLVPKLIQRAAAKTEAGANILEQQFAQTREKLYTLAKDAGDPKVNLGTELSDAYDKLMTIPKGVGKIGQRFAGMSPKAAEVMGDIQNALELSGGGVGKDQPLSALIRMKGDLAQFAWKEPTLSAEERQIFKGLAGSVDRKLRDALGAVGGDAAKGLLSDANALLKTQREYNVGLDLMETALRKTTIRGAIANVALKPVQEAAAWTLERALNHPVAMRLVKNGIKAVVDGKGALAAKLAERAFALTQAGPHVQSYLEAADAAPQ